MTLGGFLFPLCPPLHVLPTPHLPRRPRRPRRPHRPCVRLSRHRDNSCSLPPGTPQPWCPHLTINCFLGGSSGFSHSRAAQGWLKVTRGPGRPTKAQANLWKAWGGGVLGGLKTQHPRDTGIPRSLDGLSLHLSHVLVHMHVAAPDDQNEAQSRPGGGQTLPRFSRGLS